MINTFERIETQSHPLKKTNVLPFYTLLRGVGASIIFIISYFAFFANLNPAVFRRCISLHNQTLNAFSEPQHFVLEIIRAGSHSVIRQIESQMQTGRPRLQHIHPAQLYHTP